MDTPRRLRVFVDANILIRGITFPRYPYEILRLAARHTIVLVVSPSVLTDARHYLRLLFPEHLPKLDGFLATAVETLHATSLPPPRRTLTALYNARPTWLDLAHKKLDAAVFDAYGWPHDVSDEEILERLLALNHERARAGLG